MIPAKLNIIQVNNLVVPTMSTNSGVVCISSIFCIPSIEFASAPNKLTILGTGFNKICPGDLLCCTLIRLGMNKKEQKETVLTQARFINKPSDHKGKWKVVFDVEYPATYLISCHSFQDGHARNDNAYLEVKIDHIQKDANGKLSTMLSFTAPPPNFTADLITANGSILHSPNPVTCTLTPIDCSTGEYNGPSLPPVLATVSGINPNNWSVSFAPSQGKHFQGCYQLEATAAHEGTIFTSGDV